MSNPTAVLFQALPPLAPDEYRALEESIESHGIQVPVVVDENGVVIDGHHRQKIANHLGLECPTIIKSGYTDAEKRTLALSLNIDRRQLSREQKRALIAESIKADPQLSDREHGRRTGADHKTASVIREGLEANGEIPHCEERVTADGKLAPGVKPRPAIDPADPAIDSDIEPAPRVGEPFDNSEELEPEPEIAPGLTASELDELNPTSPRRRPLTDQARDAGWKVREAVERLQKVLADDRYPANKKQVDQSISAHLRFASDAIAVALGSIDQ